MLSRTDTPYRAWAAAALLSSQHAHRRVQGKRLATELADQLPALQDLHHADLVTCAILDGVGFLSLLKQEEWRSVLPRPHRQRSSRSRLFQSSPYLYLIARGTGTGFMYASELAAVLDEEIDAITSSSTPDLVDLVLLLAARWELEGPASLREDRIRASTGRVAGAGLAPEGAIALRWLLEVYHGAWPEGQAAAQLRSAATSYVGELGTHSVGEPQARPVMTAMLLELSTRAEPQLRLVSQEEQETEIARRLGKRRWTEAAAYLFVIAAMAGGTMYSGVQAGWFGPVVGWAGALGFGIPAALLAVLTVMGRPRNVAVLGFGVSLGATYIAAALYAGATQSTNLLQALQAEGAIFELLIAVLTAFWGGRQSDR